METWIGLDIGCNSFSLSVVDDTGTQIRSKEAAMDLQASGSDQLNTSELLIQIMAQINSVTSTEAETPRALGLSCANRFLLLWDRNSPVPTIGPVKVSTRPLSYYARQKLAEPTGSLNASRSDSDLQHLIRTAKENESLILGSLESWLLSQLTGSNSPLIDLSCASRFFSLDQIEQINKGAVDEDLRLNPSQLPIITPFSHRSNKLEKIHLTDGKELGVHSFICSQSAQLISSGCLSPGQGVLILGPESKILINTGTEIHDADNAFIAWHFPSGESTYYSEITISELGDTLRWLFSNFELGNSLTELHGLAKQVRTSEQVTLVPYREVANTDKATRTSLLLAGLGVSSNKCHIARAGLESIALQIAGAITEWNNSNPVPLQSLSIGNVTDDLELLFQLVSDLSQVSVLCSRFPQTPAHGAALSALFGLEKNPLSSKENSMDIARYVPSTNNRIAASKSDKWMRFKNKLAVFDQ